MEEWTLNEIQSLMEQEEKFLLYLYTPMCGTCQVAGKMIEIVAQMFPAFIWGKCNLNYIPEFAVEWKIESVPCLLIIDRKEVEQKVYAFHSVPYLYDLIKNKLQTDSR